MRTSAFITLISFMLFACASALVVPENQGERSLKRSMRIEHPYPMPHTRNPGLQPDKFQARSVDPDGPIIVRPPGRPDRSSDRFQARSVKRDGTEYPMRGHICGRRGRCTHNIKPAYP